MLECRNLFSQKDKGDLTKFMKEYQPKNIRNIGVVSHSNAGKTSLIEAILFNSGTLDKMGSVDQGTSASDHADDEIERKITINCSICVAEWGDHKLNLIDSPGADDFYGDLESVLRVVDGVIVIVDATTGIEGGTEKVWEIIEKYNLPATVFINKMDKENANFADTLDSVKNTLEVSIATTQLPIGRESDFSGVVDIIQMESSLKPNGREPHPDSDIPADMEDDVEVTREELIEVVAESDDELIEKYFEEGELSSKEIQLGIQGAFRNKAGIVPILCGSALENIGVQNLMDFVVECFPSPEDAGIIESEDGEITRDPGISSPMSALVFKTLADPFAGRLTLFRVYSGVLSGDSQVFNSVKGQNEKIGKISFMNGKDLIDTPQIVAGDFGVAIKLVNAQTGDTFCDADNIIQLPSINFPKPVISFAILPAREGDDEKLSTVLQRMSEEDPTFRIERNDTIRQLLVSGLGEVHLNVIRGRMKDKFGVETAVEDPRVAYRETIRGRANRVRGRLKKQSGGRGQFGEVWINLEPTQPGENGDDEFEFVNKVVGGSVPTNYIPAVEKGIREARTSGILAGYPFVGFRVTLYDGKHHPVDSSDLAFQIAGSQALRDATLDAKPVMLEPIMDVEISVPDQFMGDVIGDLNSRRGRVMGVEQVGKRQVIGATVPLSEMFRYSIDLKSITSARGSFTMDFSSYEQLPDELAQKVIADSKTDEAE